jgi:hypothetical protein
VLGCFPFFVGGVLRLRDAKKRSPSRAHCVGPVMQLTLWCPVVHALVMFFFIGLGARTMWEKDTGPCLDMLYEDLHLPEELLQACWKKHTDFSHPTCWFLLAVCICIALMCLEVHIAKYSSTWYSEKAAKTEANMRVHDNRAEEGSPPGRLPIRWPCIPVTMVDRLMSRSCFSTVRSWWPEHQEQWCFNVWFMFLFGLGTATLYSRLQANSFLGMLTYRYLASAEHGLMVNRIWQETLRQSFFMKRFPLPVWAILLLMVFSQLWHYAYGIWGYWPRRRWKTAGHLRWQVANVWGEKTGQWMTWGRDFEFGIKDIEFREESVADFSEWNRWREHFGGGYAAVRSATSTTTWHLAASRRHSIHSSQDEPVTVYKDDSEYNPAHEDFPLTIKWSTNRHAYTAVSGEEVTSSSVMDGIAECCSMSILSQMQQIDLMDWVKAHDFLRKYDESPTEEMAGEVIQAVRTLMNDAVNVGHRAFSRIFIYGICFCGLHLHIQITYTNALCAGRQICPSGRDLWPGIVTAFVSMLLVVAQIARIAKYYINVRHTVTRCEDSLRTEHASLERYQSMQEQIGRARNKLVGYYILLVPLCLLFIWNFAWVLSKWVMDTFVCPSHMWNFPAPRQVMNITGGCVSLNKTFSFWDS